MFDIADFELVNEQPVPEFGAVCKLLKHKETSASIFLMKNDDINKTIGIAIRTPPENSTGIQHILEHMVFSGSRKYPFKDVFVELLKGSLQNYLNAYTYLDATCYLASTPNIKDYFNCMELMLDAVFYPQLTYENFTIEGWRLEYNKHSDELTYKGIVYSEMKGHFSSASSRITENIRKSLFPDSSYSNTPGGIPEEIPDLRYEQLLNYHKRYYHPSNALFFLYGDVELESCLKKINSYITKFHRVDYRINVPYQKPFLKPARAEYVFPARKNNGNNNNSILTLNWVLDDRPDFKDALIYMMLEMILTGLNSSPLKYALLNSRYGDAPAGVGLFQDLRQPYFSTGLKGITQPIVNDAESYIINILERIVSDGIDNKLKQAAFNRIQFIIRENNFGKTPQGIQLMLRALSAWCYDKNIIDKISFEKSLADIGQIIKSDEKYFEKLIERNLLNNKHKSVVIFKPDPDLLKRESYNERNRLKRIYDSLSANKLEGIDKYSLHLQDTIKRGNSEFNKSKIPGLSISDIDTNPLSIYQETESIHRLRVLYNDIDTNGTMYMALGFDLCALPMELIRYSRLTIRLLLQKTEHKLAETISSETGGLRSGFFNILKKDRSGSVSHVLIMGKSLLSKTSSLIDIYKNLISEIKFDNHGELYNLISDELRRHESMLYSESSFKLIRYRINAHFNEAGRMSECLTGIDYIHFIKNLISEFKKAPDKIVSILNRVRKGLINRNTMIVNVTCSRHAWEIIHNQLRSLAVLLPSVAAPNYDRDFDPIATTEGFVIPSRTGIAGKGIDVYSAGYISRGAAYVVSNHLWTTWFWDKIRVTGGAYESYCDYNDKSDVFSIISNRDLSLTKTVEAVDSAGKYLSSLKLSQDELSRCIIGALRKYQSYKSPDARGHQALANYLAAYSPDYEKIVFDQILQTKASDFIDFAEVMNLLAKSEILKVLGPSELIVEIKSPGTKSMVKINMA